MRLSVRGFTRIHWRVIAKTGIGDVHTNIRRPHVPAHFPLGICPFILKHTDRGQRGIWIHAINTGTIMRSCDSARNMGAMLPAFVGRPPYRMARRCISALLRNTVRGAIHRVCAAHFPLQIRIVVFDTSINNTSQRRLISDVRALGAVSTSRHNAPSIVDIGIRIRRILLSLTESIAGIPFGSGSHFRRGDASGTNLLFT